MRMIKSAFLAVVLLASGSAWALTDSEQVELANAIENGEIAVVKRLVDDGLDLKVPAFGWTWLQVAANKNNMAMVRLMMDNGSDVNYRHPITKMTALALAVYNGNAEMVNYLISKGGDPNIKLKGNLSMVRMARDMGKQDMVDLLMQNGARDDGCLEEKCF